VNPDMEHFRPMIRHEFLELSDSTLFFNVSKDFSHDYSSAPKKIFALPAEGLIMRPVKIHNNYWSATASHQRYEKM